MNDAQVMALPIGLSDREGLVPFHAYLTNAGKNGLCAWENPATYSTTLTAIARAETLVQRGLLDTPNVVKIDVQDAELEGLRGLGSTLANPECRAIVIESNADALEAHHPIHELLSRNGFKMRRLVRQESTAHDPDNYMAERSRNT